jgi:hypothetical protein
VDQEREYWTSGHGRALRAGDLRVATCVDCHGVHGTLRATDPDSPVYPTRVAQTCRACHGDAERMKDPAGGPSLSTDQYAGWRRSVHGEALLDRGDLFAPTCNDCHGNHGAAPPGVESIAFVCGQCHGRESGLFRESAKAAGYQRHEEYLREAEGEGCAACHESPEPQAELPAPTTLHECATCHGNHAVMRPSIAMLSPLPETPCALCHGEGEESDEREATRRAFVARRDALLAEAREFNLDGGALFDWLVDRTLELDTHTVDFETGNEDGGRSLRPPFERLFTKFRVGRIQHRLMDPDTGEELVETVVRCSDCHGPEPLLAEEDRGYAAAEVMLERQKELMIQAARAQRLLLAARRGGVEVGRATLGLNQVVDRQIELQVLVHGFSADEGSPFQEKAAEGLELAAGVVEAGRNGLAELRYRRTGLAVSLAVVALVLLALYLKIRQLSSEEPLGKGS